MATTLLLAKLLGLYLALMGLAMALNRQSMLASIDEILRSRPLLLLSALIALMAGLGIVLAHNDWRGGVLSLAVTLSGWAALLKGAIFLLLPPELSLRCYLKLGYERFYYFYAGFTFFLGLGLLAGALLA